jgi:hypothetical protein
MMPGFFLNGQPTVPFINELTDTCIPANSK